MTATILKRCSFTGCRVHVPANVRYCAEHRSQVNRTYGRRHRESRAAVFEQAGFRCHYCGQPVTMSDDVAHLDRTMMLTPGQALGAPKVPAHRSCHNAHAPHLG